MKTLTAGVDRWEISRKRITLEEVIGSGSFGTVWRAVLRSENGRPGIQFVAAKVLYTLVPYRSNFIHVQVRPSPLLSFFECSFTRIPLFIPS